MEMGVRFVPEMRDYLEELVTVLYQKEYFNWLDTSQQYVDGLVCDIITHLPHRLHKPAPPYFSRYGKSMYYATFKKSKHTEWYIFFTAYSNNGETVYLVRYMANNHIVAQHL